VRRRVLAGGFTDSGYTWGPNDLLNQPPAAVANQRIDLILLRGDLKARTMTTMTAPVTAHIINPGPFAPQWPSDHLAVAATIGIHVSKTGADLPWSVVNDDPATAGAKALFVVGTNDPESIYIDQTAAGMSVAMSRPGGSARSLPVSVNGHVYVYAGGGSDSIALGPRVTRDAVGYAMGGHDTVIGGAGNDILDGGEGNDFLTGGRGNDILLGSAGNDMLFGGEGGDLLIGGTGSDWLAGDGNGDVLLGGTTLYDSAPQSLRAILAEWNAGGSIDQRIGHLTNGGGLNGSIVLTKGTTVLDDGARDLLFGGSGGDWFRPFALDLALDKIASDRAS
jgi:Ca2+-binding RTX toxin-like protein